METSHPPPESAASDDQPQVEQRGARARAVAPDLARGLMLLLIALANIPWSIYGLDTDGISPHGHSTDLLDQIWQAFAIVAVDSRSYPLFAFLFGYGIWQLYSRQRAAGVDPREARRLLQRRHAWMLAFGAVHALLLWMGDVVGAYGLIGLIITWLFLDRRNRTLIVWAIVLAGLLVLGSLFQAIGGLAFAAYASSGAEVAAMALPNVAGMESYWLSMPARLGFWVIGTLGMGVVGIAVPVAILCALVAARHGVLEQPELHRRLLRRTAVWGILIGVVGGVPSAIVHLSGSDVPGWAFQALHTATGIAGGLGYAALFGLIAARVNAARPGRAARALTAVGKRSLSCYLAQSVLIVPVLSAWGLGLGGTMTQWQGALYAIGVWLVTVVFAVALERAGKRGPAEWLLRRLSYRRGRDAAPVPVTG